MPKKSAPAAAPSPRATAASSRLFVLDTNVLLHDPYSLFRFAEHDVYVPFVTLEELDNKKAGTQDVNRNARQATRLIEDVVSQHTGNMTEGFPLNAFNGGHAAGRLFVQRESLPFLPNEYAHKNDNLYLSVLNHLTRLHPGRHVVMVTKDLNLRIKARALGFVAEDYRYDHAVDDADLLYSGLAYLDKEPYETDRPVDSWKESSVVHYRVPDQGWVANEFLVGPSGALYQVMHVKDGQAVIVVVVDYKKAHRAVMGVCARNEEQQAALALLLDDEVDFVALLGPAGTGKTLLALAAGLDMVRRGRFDEILFTRATVPLGEDIGYLPGSEEEKLEPWLGAMRDNIEVLCEAAGESAVEQQKVRELAKEHVRIRAITFMRGRTFHRKFVILDEAQNLTPKQMKALITRAGDGAKVVVLGNLAQIDSPYLSETSSGLAVAVERFKGWPHFGALVLDKGERSRLANEGNERL